MTVQSRLQTKLNVTDPPHLLEQFKPPLRITPILTFRTSIVGMSALVFRCVRSEICSSSIIPGGDQSLRFYNVSTNSSIILYSPTMNVESSDDVNSDYFLEA